MFQPELNNSAGDTPTNSRDTHQFLSRSGVNIDGFLCQRRCQKHREKDDSDDLSGKSHMSKAFTAGLFLDQLDLKDFRPLLAGDIELVSTGVIGDPVEDV